MGGKYSYPQRHFETIHSSPLTLLEIIHQKAPGKSTRKTAALETNLSEIANPIFRKDKTEKR